MSLAPDEEARSLGPALAQLDKAIARGKTVRFLYPTGPALQPRERVVDPYGLTRIGGHWYVGGRDHDRDALRTFRLSRLAGPVRFATKRPRDFSPPTGIDPAEFRARPPWQLGEILGSAQVRVDDDLAWWVARAYPVLSAEPYPAPPDRTRNPDAMGSRSTLFTTPYADAEALITWVLSLGSKAELLNPPELRRLLRKKLEALVKAHA